MFGGRWSLDLTFHFLVSSTIARGGNVDAQLGYNTIDDSEWEGHEGDFFSFMSAPQIQAPRWRVEKHEPQDVAPGYWFVAPYEHTFRPAPLPAWVGPHIYDGGGQLVWSGAAAFYGSDSYDFRISQIGMDQLMTFAYRDDCAAVFMDSNYRKQKEGRFAQNLGDLNMHDFNVVDWGQHALVLTKERGMATEEMSRAVGLEQGQCQVGFDGFKLMDITSEDFSTIFEWSTFDHLPLTESTFMDHNIEKKCSSGWDAFHLNSVDRCPDGNYLLSSRHTDTIYHINATDGSIMWRLGGLQSNFQQDFAFSRQHDIRCREQDGDRYTVTLLDNAKGSDSQNATHDYSRGLKIELDAGADPKIARLVQEYPHPQREHVTSRGNFEIMPNGNVFMGWASQCLQSEYTPDGKLVMEAELVPEFLDTYRAYKFPFKGEPTDPPDVHSEVFEQERDPRSGAVGALATHVYVSWNGATEVKEWKLYRSDSSAKKKEEIATVKRTGFETLITYEGSISYVVVEAIDAWGHGMRNGRSGVVMTVHPSDWQGSLDSASSPAKGKSQHAGNAAASSDALPTESQYVSSKARPLRSPVTTFLAGFLSMAILFIVGWLLTYTYKNRHRLSSVIRGRGTMDYLPLAESEHAEPKILESREVIQTRERSTSKVQFATSVSPLKQMGHRRGESYARLSRMVPPTP